jgi:hypothetical protein
MTADEGVIRAAGNDAMIGTAKLNGMDQKAHLRYRIRKDGQVSDQSSGGTAAPGCCKSTEADVTTGCLMVTLTMTDHFEKSIVRGQGALDHFFGV